MCFQSFEGSGKAFQNTDDFLGFWRIATVLSFRGTDVKVHVKRSGKAATAKSRPAEGPIVGPTGPWFTSSGCCQVSQLLFLCRIWSNNLCKSKSKSVLQDGCCGPGDKSWMCSVPRAAPAFHSSFRYWHPPLFFCQYHLPQQQHGWSRRVEWWHCSEAVAAIKAVLFH